MLTRPGLIKLCGVLAWRQIWNRGFQYPAVSDRAMEEHELLQKEIWSLHWHSNTISKVFKTHHMRLLSCATMFKPAQTVQTAKNCVAKHDSDARPPSMLNGDRWAWRASLYPNREDSRPELQLWLAHGIRDDVNGSNWELIAACAMACKTCWLVQLAELYMPDQWNLF